MKRSTDILKGLCPFKTPEKNKIKNYKREFEGLRPSKGQSLFETPKKEKINLTGELEGRSPSKLRLIAFDLEGPLSPQDNAYEVMGLTERGYELFERLSRYDDILTLEERPDYEPGDTLYLIIPFLMAEGITKEDILKISQSAGLTPGAKETIETLKQKGFQIVIISTSYETHAQHIGSRLGISEEFIACTPFKAEGLRLMPQERELILSEKKKVLEIPLTDDQGLKRELDSFYLEKLPSLEIYRDIKKIKVVGGRRKVEALRRFMESFGARSSETVCIGDSITDFRMLDYINKAGGLAIVFNGNEYSLPYGTVAVASDTLEAVIPVIENFYKNGQEGLKDISSPYHAEYSLICEIEDMNSLISIHKLMRKKIRGRAGELG